MKIISIAVLATASLLTAACADDVPVNQRHLELDYENGLRELRFPGEDSPRLQVLTNGYVSVRCPVGFRFRTRVVRSGPGGQYETSTCEAVELQPADPTPPHTPESGMTAAG